MSKEVLKSDGTRLVIETFDDHLRLLRSPGDLDIPCRWMVDHLKTHPEDIPRMLDVFFGEQNEEYRFMFGSLLSEVYVDRRIFDELTRLDPDARYGDWADIGPEYLKMWCEYAEANGIEED